MNDRSSVPDSQHKPTLLLVDDVPENIDILRSALKNDYRLRIAVNGQKALEIIEKTELPDLILLDIMMPVMDGYETCRRLKEDPVKKNIPVIFLTAKTEEQDVLEAFRAGAVDYVQKPFRLPELQARIRTSLEIQEGRRALALKNQELKEILHILSHDLASPFANILSVLSLMEDGDIAEFLPELARSARQGEDIIALVRQFRSLDEKGLENSRVDLAEAWQDSVATLHRRYQLKGVHLTPERFTASWPVRAERVSLINSVLNNLLSNALKFTPAGRSVTADISRHSQQTVFLLRDQGIGMPPEIAENLFDPSARHTHRPGTDGEEGSGFGMPIVWKVMELYGGSIQVKTEPGAGTEFRLEFQSESEKG